MAARTWTDEQMLDAVRSAADGVDGPLTVSAYDAWRSTRGQASGIGIIRRFGKWHVACEKAGLEVVVKTTKKPTYSSDLIIAAVAVYLGEPDSRGSYNGYMQWAKKRDGVPSGPTVRNHFPKWAELVQLARAG